MTTETSSRHPLLEKKIIGIASWEQWLKRWQDVTTAEELISLLHYGFDAGGSDIYAKATFYFGIADGHAERDGKFIGSRSDDAGRQYRTDGMQTSLRRSNPPQEYDYTSVELRRLIAKKAWEVLCVKFFGGWVSNQGSRANPGWFHYWGGREQDLELLKLLFDFLDPKHGINNLPTDEDHHRKVLENFMQAFIKTAWNVGERSIYPGDAQKLGDIILLCRESRPRLLNMISSLGWENMLLKLSFDDRTLPYLEAQVAAWNKQQMWNRTLEEWAAQGYKPAQTVLLLRNQVRVERMRKKKKAA
ncbi:MAG: hypothetical protein V4681_01055 [Patescibacteria group bacterium]